MIELRYDYIGLKERGTRPTMEEVVTMIEEYGGKFEGIKGIQIVAEGETIEAKIGLYLSAKPACKLDTHHVAVYCCK